MLSAETVDRYLRERGLLGPGAAVEVRELGGGVSNVVLAVEGEGLRALVKQALPRLRVEEEWLAPRERSLTEAAALELAGELVPGAVPSVLDADEDARAIVIALAPDGWTTWKDELLGGRADPRVAARLGTILGTLHAGTVERSDTWRFADLEAFEQLRIDPYHRTVMRRLPDVAGMVAEAVDELLTTQACLVHGDFSPKNVLVGGDGLWVVDFEVAHLGAPVFDVAFMLNHLMLKSIHRPAGAEGYCECAYAFLGVYGEVAPPELLPDLERLLAHTGCLMLARVDGKSPAEYLTPQEREAARRLGRELLAGPPASLEQAWYALIAEVEA